jgi:Aspartyl protease
VTPFGRDPIETRFLLDTGASGTNVAFWKDFIEKHDLAAGVHGLSDTEATGFGGSHSAKEGLVRAIRIGGIRIADPKVRLNVIPYGDANVFGGNLGSSFFKQFKVTFDLPHDRLILIPSQDR